MSTSNNFTDTLNANFKERYADQIENLIPDGVKAYNRVSFAPRKAQLGNLYHQPVVLGLEHGVTFAGPTDDAFNLEAPVSGVIRDAQIRGSQMVLRSVLGYAAAQRAASGEGAAFVDSTKFLVENMLRSMAKKIEIQMFYGLKGYAAITGSPSGNTVTINTADWSPGIWAGAEGLPVQIRDTAGTTIRGQATVSSVDLDARTVTFDAIPSGVSDTDVIWHRGAYGNEFDGFHSIITKSGTLFNINNSNYNLFKGNSLSISPTGALTLAKIQDAIARGVEKGLDSDVTVFVNPRTWADLLTEQTALRMYDSSYSSASMKNGSQEIMFYGQNGMVEVVPSIYIKEGHAFVLCLDEYMRIGSTDITFKRPGQGDQFFRELENSAGFELRAYTDQALFTYSPGKNSIITGITN